MSRVPTDDNMRDWDPYSDDANGTPVYRVEVAEAGDKFGRVYVRGFYRGEQRHADLIDRTVAKKRYDWLEKFAPTSTSTTIFLPTTRATLTSRFRLRP